MRNNIWLRGGVYPIKLGIFYDFHLLKVGVKKDKFAGYGTQIVFCNLYIALWIGIKDKKAKPLKYNIEYLNPNTF